MAPEAGKYKDYWANAKKTFQRTTKVAKPAETILFWRKGTGIEAALKKLDAVSAASWRGQEGFAAYKKALDAFMPNFLAYRTSLDQAVEDAKKNVGIPKKVDGAAYLKALETLNTELRLIETVATARASNSLTAVNLTKNVPLTVERAKAFAAKVKQDPKPATFNTGIRKAARDVTQQIGNIDKLNALGMDTGRTNPTALFKILAAWGDTGRKVPDTATTAEVTREVRAFEQAIAGVEKWYNGK